MRAAKSARPQWADKLESLRVELGLSQAALARKLKVSAMAPSRWERGVNQPPAEVFVELGKLAGRGKCWYFWGHAGLRKSDVTAVMRDVRRSKARRGKLEISAAGDAAKFATAQRAALLLALPLYETTLPLGTLGATTIRRHAANEF